MTRARRNGLSVGIATCSLAPRLDEDGTRLRAAFEGLGVAYTVGVWNDPGVDWSVFDTVLVRSTWDYPLQHTAFLRWIRSCAATVNPAAVLRWNTDKSYLRDLAAAGVPIVPTEFVAPGDSPSVRWRDVVIKPAVGGSAANTGRFATTASPAAQQLFASLHAAGRDVMVQPYQHGIDTDGETSLVFIDGDFSHAVRRAPLLGRSEESGGEHSAGRGERSGGPRGPVTVAEVLATVQQVEPTQQQQAVAAAALEVAPGGRAALAYARVDLVPGAMGPVLLELEATDCFLFLAYGDTTAASRLAASTYGPARAVHAP